MAKLLCSVMMVRGQDGDDMSCVGMEEFEGEFRSEDIGGLCRRRGGDGGFRSEDIGGYY